MAMDDRTGKQRERGAGRATAPKDGAGDACSSSSSTSGGGGGVAPMDTSGAAATPGAEETPSQGQPAAGGFATTTSHHVDGPLTDSEESTSSAVGDLGTSTAALRLSSPLARHKKAKSDRDETTSATPQPQLLVPTRAALLEEEEEDDDDDAARDADDAHVQQYAGDDGLGRHHPAHPYSRRHDDGSLLSGAPAGGPFVASAFGGGGGVVGGPPRGRASSCAALDEATRAADDAAVEALLRDVSRHRGKHATALEALRTHADCAPHDRPPGHVGAYAPSARRARIALFHRKRAARVWTKKVKYDVRKNFADSRMRVKGRFVKKEDEDLLRDLLAVV